MKKVLSLLLILAMVLGLGLLFTGCGDKEPYSNYDLSEYITLPDYDSFETTVPEVDVTDKELQDAIDQGLEAKATTEKVTEGAVAKGDTVTIKFEGRLADGTAVDGMSSESSSLTLGSGSMIPGFEEGIYGATIGQEISVDVTFPDPYTNNEDLSGKPATFKITVLSKDVKVIPELNEEFVTKNSEYKTVEEFTAALKKQLEQAEYDEQLYSIKEKLYTQIVEKTKVKKYPEKEIKAERKALDKTYKQLAEENNMSWDEYLKEKLKLEQADYDEQADLYVQQLVKQEMVIYAIAEKEGLEVTDEEYEQQLEAMLTSTGFADEEAFENYTGMTLDEYAEAYKFDRDILLTKELDTIYDRLVDNGNVAEETETAEDTE